MHSEILPHVIFAPGTLAIDLAKGLESLGHEVTFFSPNFEIPEIKNVQADLYYFEWELKQRGYGYIDLLKKHPLTFITLARQIQSELISKAYFMADKGQFDLVHVFTNEEDTALQFAQFCVKPVIFTHHEPFNYLAKYKNSFPKFKGENWVSISLSQRKSMPESTNWIGNVYNGIQNNKFTVNLNPHRDYVAYFGRIIQPKGVHLAIAAANKAGVRLKIAGKHYSDFGNDQYWGEKILPFVDGEKVEYLGFINSQQEHQRFLGNASVLLVPSIWEEPFGMVSIEALATGTPVIGLANGALPEIIKDKVNGYLVQTKLVINEEGKEVLDEERAIDEIAAKIPQIKEIKRKVCRETFEERFTTARMCKGYEEAYLKIIS